MSDRNWILCEFRNKTKSIMGDSLKQMILYGSYARGDYGDNSDMDIMVLTELTDDRIIQIEDEIFDAAYDIELALIEKFNAKNCLLLPLQSCI